MERPKWPFWIPSVSVCVCPCLSLCPCPCPCLFVCVWINHATYRRRERGGKRELVDKYQKRGEGRKTRQVKPINWIFQKQIICQGWQYVYTGGGWNKVADGMGNGRKERSISYKLKSGNVRGKCIRFYRRVLLLSIGQNVFWIQYKTQVNVTTSTETVLALHKRNKDKQGR
jgi:hypothetical protein